MKNNGGIRQPCNAPCGHTYIYRETSTPKEETGWMWNRDQIIDLVIRGRREDMQDHSSQLATRSPLRMHQLHLPSKPDCSSAIWFAAWLARSALYTCQFAAPAELANWPTTAILMPNHGPCSITVTAVLHHSARLNVPYLLQYSNFNVFNRESFYSSFYSAISLYSGQNNHMY